MYSRLDLSTYPVLRAPTVPASRLGLPCTWLGFFQGVSACFQAGHFEEGAYRLEEGREGEGAYRSEEGREGRVQCPCLLI